jgi:hypothetical protein
VAAQSLNSEPPENPGEELRGFDITLPAPGRLVVFAHNVSAVGYCNFISGGPTGCSTTIGLYVDGRAIRGDTSLGLGGGNGAFEGKAAALSGITTELTAGPHHVTLSRRDTPPGPLNAAVQSISVSQGQLPAFQMTG